MFKSICSNWLYFTFFIFLNPVISFSQCLENEILNLRKTALVFGEKSYKYANALVNPANDAQAIGDSLEKLNYDVHLVIDADKKTMAENLERWYSNLKRYNVGLFYYSGHGAEYNGENYLFPVDANPKSPEDLSSECFSANGILNKLDEANLKYDIMLLDACRSNPFTKSWSRDISAGGLATMTGKGSFIGFAASPGKTASDGSGGHGPYTEGILNYVMIPDLTIDQMFTKVNAYVRRITNNQQITFKNSSLNVDYCFSVKRTIQKKSQLDSRFGQPPSETFISSDGLLLFNSTDSGLQVRDALTLNNIYSIKCEYNTRSKIVSRTGKIAISLDVTRRRLLIFDITHRLVKYSVMLEEAPTSMALNNSETLAYVSFADSFYKGYCTIDISNGSIVKRSRLDSAPVDIAIGGDDKFIYVLSRDSVLKLSLIKEKVISRYGRVGGGKVFGISPDNMKILISNDDGHSGETIILNSQTLKPIKILKFKFDVLSFTLDSSMALLIRVNDIFIISLKTDSLINRIPFSGQPKGVATTNDGIANVWIPNENRYHVVDTKLLLEVSSSDPEVILKNFKEESKNDYNDEIADRNALGNYFDTLQKVYEDEINSIAKELGDKYHPTIRRGVVFIDASEINGFNFEKKAFGDTYGLFTFDNKRRILPHMIAKIESNYLIVEIHSIPEDPAELQTYRTLRSQTDWAELGAFVRKYFIDRLYMLRELK